VVSQSRSEFSLRLGQKVLHLPQAARLGAAQADHSLEHNQQSWTL